MCFSLNRDYEYDYDYVVCTEGYCFVMLLSCFISSGALEGSDVLLSYSIIIKSLHNTIILIMTITKPPDLSPDHLIT